MLMLDQIMYPRNAPCYSCVAGFMEKDVHDLVAPICEMLIGQMNVQSRLNLLNDSR